MTKTKAILILLLITTVSLVINWYLYRTFIVLSPDGIETPLFLTRLCFYILSPLFFGIVIAAVFNLVRVRLGGKAYNANGLKNNLVYITSVLICALLFSPFAINYEQTLSLDYKKCPDTRTGYKYITYMHVKNKYECPSTKFIRENSSGIPSTISFPRE